jgi:hypothetical protein
LKDSSRRKLDALRQRFVLTPAEKRIIVFVVAAFALGVIAKCYRDRHAQVTPHRQQLFVPSPTTPAQKAPRH